jgi:hypothetical protein
MRYKISKHLNKSLNVPDYDFRKVYKVSKGNTVYIVYVLEDNYAAILKTKPLSFIPLMYEERLYMYLIDELENKTYFLVEISPRNEEIWIERDYRAFLWRKVKEGYKIEKVK